MHDPRIACCACDFSKRRCGNFLEASGLPPLGVYMGEVIGDLNSRRGQIQAMEERSGVRVVKAVVPLSEMFGYVGDLRSRTQGRADYSMQFDSYAEVPPSIAKEIIAKARGE